MDTQMREWCRALAEKKCVGEPWKNVGKTKVRVFSQPALDAPPYEGEYLAPGATFGVEMTLEASADGRRWLQLANGGWISDRSRKDVSKVVAERADRHSEMADADVFEIGVKEDRREAYMRMVHRRNEANLRVPEGLRVELLPYQVEGLEWLVSLFNNGLAGLLADEMGLGKTIQTVALLAFLKESKSRYGPHLVICPKSVVLNWKNEISRCFPEYEEHILIFGGPQAERDAASKRIRKTMKKAKRKLIVVTNYEQVHPDKNHVLHEPTWETIVVDEGHRMKNQKSVFHQTMKERFRARMKLLLTGTPLQNNMDELFSLLSYLLPEIFTSASSFKSWFAAPVMDKLVSMNMNEYYVEFSTEEEQMLVSNLHAMLAPFLLQRTKADVLDHERLPPRREEVIRVPLSAWQKRTYEELGGRLLRRVDEAGGEVKADLLQNTTMQLRKIVLHPYLFGRGAGVRGTEDLLRASGKVEALDRMLRKLRRFGHKVLLFSQFTRVLDVLEELLRLRSWPFERIDGQVSAEERQQRINRFSEPDGDTFVFLLSSKAGAVGLNLQAADTVILFDLDWNPQNDKQAIARAHRIGQTKEVLVVRLLTVSPIEAHMEKVALEKLDLEKKIIGAGGFSKKGGTKSPEERAQLLKDLFDECSAQDGDDALRSTALAEVNALMARNQEERDAFDEEDASALGMSLDSLPDATVVPAKDGDSVAELLMARGRLMAPCDVPIGFELLEEDEASE
eukprot:TRINITY_DN27240_c0_g2_i1.p1 TRINITY_DN27240_c0_g2~~TRINITY_DN27240_c0_g2_i1.p1  ORF type:complete len:780 (+),score=237.36 TRINITY_DN27240_c0_g2_i1:133-2340(+)